MLVHVKQEGRGCRARSGAELPVLDADGIQGALVCAHRTAKGTQRLRRIGRVWRKREYRPAATRYDELLTRPLDVMVMTDRSKMIPQPTDQKGKERRHRKAGKDVGLRT